MADFLAQNPYQKTAAADLAIARTDPPYAWITEAQGDLAVAMQAALTGKQSVAAALAAAQQQATDAMKGSK
jgi:ABC-type glycerol-3-phosphate transport system substrate-binding protein